MRYRAAAIRVAHSVRCSPDFKAWGKPRPTAFSRFSSRPLAEHTGALPDRALADITAIRNAVDGALEIFGPTKDLVLSGNLEKAMEDGVGRVLDVAASRLRPGDES